MSLFTIAEPVPLSSDADGVIRVGGTRVTLDTLVAAFRQGMTPEGIVEQYPSLRLSQVYSAIGYILDHAQEVESYLHGRPHIADEIRRDTEVRFDPIGVRDRLLARKRQG